MPYNKSINQKRRKTKSNKGFTLVEALVGLVMFEVALAGLLPLMMVSRTFALRSDSRIGAIAVAQQVMDSLRQIDVKCLPTSANQVTSLPDKTCPSPAPSGGGDSIASIPYKGKTYSATITYCANTSAICNTNTRLVQVLVYSDNNPNHFCDPNGRPDQSQCPVFQLTNIFTRLQ